MRVKRASEKGPLRTCVGCSRVAHPETLNRVVLREGRVIGDPSGRKAGRGAYICSSLVCVRKAIEKGGFNRSFRVRVERTEPECLASELRNGLAGYLAVLRQGAERGRDTRRQGSQGCMKHERLSRSLLEWEDSGEPVFNIQKAETLM